MKKNKKSNEKKIKFVLTIGDEGAILICMDGKTLLRRFFITSPTSPDFINFLSSYPDAPLYILVDLVEQAYIQQTLPPVSSFNVSKLIARKLEKDFDATDIKAAMSMGKDKGKKKEWNYLFISVRNIPPFSDWVEAASNLPNYFAGIYLLPIEGMSFLKDIKKHQAKIQKEAAGDSKEKITMDAKWQIIVLHNRVGGFRQIVFKNDRVLFTRMAQPIGGQTPDVIAGNIEQETLNTIEYIRRLGFEDDMGVDIFVVTSSTVKEALEAVPKTSKSPIVLTPFELAEQFGLESAAEERDRFGDVVFAAHFVNTKKHILPLFTDYIKKVNGFIKTRKMIKMAAILIMIGGFSYSAYLLFSTFSIKDEIESAHNTKIGKNNSLTKKEAEDRGFEEDPALVEKVARIDTLLDKDMSSPLDFVSKLFLDQNYNSHVKELDLQITENKNEPDTIESNFNYVFYTQDQAERMMDNDNFKTKIESIFPTEKCNDECYSIRWEGLLSLSDIQLAIGKKEEEGDSYQIKTESIIDLVIDGPFKENSQDMNTRKRR